MNKIVKRDYRTPPHLPEITPGHSLLIEYVVGGIMSPEAQATRAYAKLAGRKYAIRAIGHDGITITRTR
jgi:hypothetical protein